MKDWEHRPTEVANLLNPAFVAVLLRQAVDGYESEAGGAMPFPLVFLVPAFSLHPPTAARLPRAVKAPKTGASTFHPWLQNDDNRDVVVDLGRRVADVAPFVREALLFAGQRRVLEFDADGRVTAGRNKPYGVTGFVRLNEDVASAMKNSKFMGRWLALAGTDATIFALLGLRP